MRVEAKSASEEFERLTAGELAGLRVGLLHGQMAAAAREEVMDRFRTGELQVLVATTVIEVGVDVPEATVMVVESADRFGIAQLHQLRGRVGRGGTASWCYLLGGEEGNERLTAVAGSTDGFALAEADLRVRGEGTLLGARQKGQSDLRLASLSDAGDMALLDEARRVAEAMVDADPATRRRTPTWPTRSGCCERGRGGVPLQELTRSGARDAVLRLRSAVVLWVRRTVAVPMRVIAGRSRGRRLPAKLPASVRPTSDRVREAIFDILGSQGGVEGLTVVDLFCGSGALGVEALSRGAASSTFVDSTRTCWPPSARTWRRWGSTTSRRRSCGPRCPGWLDTAAAGPFDLALCDPPYDFEEWPALLGALRADAVVMESAAPIVLPEAWVVVRERRYGGTLVTVAHRSRRRLVNVGLFPGSFDPFHNGHLEIVERASRLFDEVVVAALRNPQKSTALFDLEERQAMLEEVVAHLAVVRIVSVSTLLVNVARDVGASAIVRGLRAVSDFEAEMQMAQMNNHLSGVETIFIPTSPEWSFVASKLVREVARFGGDVSAFVPKVVAEQLKAKYADGPPGGDE